MPVWDTFQSDLPKWPYCTDWPADGLRQLPRDTAIAHRNIQVAHRHTIIWQFFDIDHADAGTAWEDANLPAPNVIIQNPLNRHAHVGYRLRIPVAKHDAARRQPLEYLADVERGMARRLRADRGYTGLIAKNPLHPHWQTRWLAPGPYDLEQLAADLTADDKRRLPLIHEMGVGRNCTLFDTVRHEGYRLCRQFKSNDMPYRLLAREIFAVAADINEQFPVPLHDKEVMATCRSIAKWSWQNFTDEKFSAIQSERGILSGRARKAEAEQRRDRLSGLYPDMVIPVAAVQPDELNRIATELGVSVDTARTDLAKIGVATERRDRIVAVFGQEMNVSQAADVAGVPRKTLSDRISKGLSPDAAIVMPRRDGTRVHRLPNGAAIRAALKAAIERERRRA